MKRVLPLVAATVVATVVFIILLIEGQFAHIKPDIDSREPLPMIWAHRGYHPPPIRGRSRLFEIIMSPTCKGVVTPDAAGV